MNVPPPAIVEKKYCYYSNGAYELEETRDANGLIQKISRHITGPIPENELWEMVNGVARVDPAAPNWQASLTERLSAHRFNTVNIIHGVPLESGVTLYSYIKSFLTWKTAAKAAILGGGITFLAVSPAILASQAPKVAAQLGLKTMSTTPVVKYSVQSWSAILLPKCPSSAVGVFLAVGQSYVITKISMRIFEKLNETCGPKGFRAWQANKMNIFIQNREDLIPAVYEEDEVLADNQCPITDLPIRVPFRTKYGHLFEESAINAWIAQQIANDLPPTCPLTRQSLTFQDLHLDVALSDRIELRLLLLNALSH